MIHETVTMFEEGMSIDSVDLELMAEVFIRLVSYPYWARLWVVQKVLLAGKLGTHLERHRWTTSIPVILIEEMLGNLNAAGLLHKMDD